MSRRSLESSPCSTRLSRRAGRAGEARASATRRQARCSTKDDGEERLDELGERLDALQYRLFAEGTAQRPARPAGARRVGEGRRHPLGLRRLSTRSGVRSPRSASPTATELAARLPLARPRGAARARRDRHLQPLALRGHRRRAHARARAGGGLAPPRTSHIREFERMLVDEGTRSSRCSSTSRARSSAARCRSGSTTPRSAGSSGATTSRCASASTSTVAAWDEAITETSTAWAPWHVVPADRNWVKALAVAELLAADARGARPAAAGARGGHRGPSRRVARHVAVSASDMPGVDN